MEREKRVTVIRRMRTKEKKYIYKEMRKKMKEYDRYERE